MGLNSSAPRLRRSPLAQHGSVRNEVEAQPQAICIAPARRVRNGHRFEQRQRQTHPAPCRNVRLDSRLFRRKIMLSLSSNCLQLDAKPIGIVESHDTRRTLLFRDRAQCGEALHAPSRDQTRRHASCIAPRLGFRLCRRAAGRSVYRRPGTPPGPSLARARC